MVEALAAVHLLRPVRVLIGGDDGEVVAHLRDELVRLGFDTMSTTRSARVAELAALERVNVVILDVSGGLAAAVALASTVEALPQRVQVLLAGRRGRAASRLGYDVIDPAAPAEELAAAVHRAFRSGPAAAGRSARP